MTKQEMLAYTESKIEEINALILGTIKDLVCDAWDKGMESANTDKAEEFAFLDPLLMRTPGVAISECVAMANRMGELAHETLLLAVSQLTGYTEERENQILANEDKLDIYEDKLGNYLVTISQHGVSMTDMRTVSRLLHAIGDFERIGDHALNLQDSAKELHEKETSFSQEALTELRVVTAALDEIMDKAFASFGADDVALAYAVEPLEETIDRLTEEIRRRHVQRLQSGTCTIQLGFVLSDLLTNLERVSDHCSNIAMSVIEERSSMDRHAYANDLHDAESFGADLAREMAKYQLPKA